MTADSPADQLAPGWRMTGHTAARRFLERSIALGRLSHAYLITGPAGVGRTTLALGLARAVNCEAASGRPCGKCRQCERIARGLHAAVRVIDRHTPVRGVASTEASKPEEDQRSTGIKIDHIRELQHDAMLNPFEGVSHVFIIDEAEVMRAEAANALLKTLEEPVAGVLLVLIAPAASSLPVTVVSRCQRIDLRPVPAAEIEQGLIDLAGADPQEARELAVLADGKPAWAFSALADPTARDRHRQAVMRLLDAATGGLDARFRYARDMAGIYRRDRSAVERELALWLGWWRDVLLVKYGLHGAVANSEWEDTLAALAGHVDAQAIAGVVEAVRDAANALSRNAVPQLAIEVLMLALPHLDAGVLPDPPAVAARADGRNAADATPAER